MNKVKMPKIMSLSELHGWGGREPTEADWRVDHPEYKKWHLSVNESLTIKSKPTFWNKVLMFFGGNVELQQENLNLRRKLLAAIAYGEDAGRAGLALYAENEVLRDENKELKLRVKDPEEYARTYASFIEKEDKLVAENKKLRVLTDKLATSLSKIEEEWEELVLKGVYKESKPV